MCVWRDRPSGAWRVTGLGEPLAQGVKYNCTCEEESEFPESRNLHWLIYIRLGYIARPIHRNNQSLKKKKVVLAALRRVPC